MREGRGVPGGAGRGVGLGTPWVRPANVEQQLQTVCNRQSGVVLNIGPEDILLMWAFWRGQGQGVVWGRGAGEGGCGAGAGEAGGHPQLPPRPQPTLQ